MSERDDEQPYALGETLWVATDAGVVEAHYSGACGRVYFGESMPSADRDNVFRSRPIAEARWLEREAHTLVEGAHRLEVAARRAMTSANALRSIAAAMREREDEAMSFPEITAYRTEAEHLDEWVRLSTAYFTASDASSAALRAGDLDELTRCDAVREAAYEAAREYRRRWLAKALALPEAR